MGGVTWAQLFKQYGCRTIVGITCQLFAQFNGINVILCDLPENLLRAGFIVDHALLYVGFSPLIYCTSTIPTMFLVDKGEWKVFLLLSLVGNCALAGSLTLVGGLHFYAGSLQTVSLKVGAADGIFAGDCFYLFFFGTSRVPKHFFPLGINSSCAYMPSRLSLLLSSKTPSYVCKARKR